MKRVLAAFLALLLLLPLAACTQTQAEETPSGYDRPEPVMLEKVHENFDRERCFYDLSMEDPEWGEVGSTAARRRLLHLDESVFTDLPTKEVLRAVMEYPLLIELTAGNTPQEGAELLSRHCTAMKVLMQRPDALAVVEEAEKDVYAYTGTVETTVSSKEFFPWYLAHLHCVLAEKE